MSRPAAVRIDDLARPTYPPDIVALREAVVPMAEGIRMEPDVVLAEAQEATGLSDFGDPGFEVRLEVLLRSFREEAALSPFGVINSHGLTVQLVGAGSVDPPHHRGRLDHGASGGPIRDRSRSQASSREPTLMRWHSAPRTTSARCSSATSL